MFKYMNYENNYVCMYINYNYNNNKIRSENSTNKRKNAYN